MPSTTRFQYIEMVERGKSPSGKTIIWDVYNRDNDSHLGDISWYGKWRQYVFAPDETDILSAGCLKNIAVFLDDQNEKHRRKNFMEKLDKDEA